MTASPAHATEITSSHVALEERLEVPSSGVVAVAAATGSGTAIAPSTTTAQEEPATHAATLLSLLDHVSAFVLVTFTIESAISAPDGSSPRGYVQLV